MHSYRLIRKKIKKMYLRIQDDEVIVSAPLYVSKSDIDRFVLDHEKWIDEHIERQKYIFNPNQIRILGEHYRIIHTCNICKIENKIIYCPSIKKVFDKLIYEYTKDYFYDRFYELCEALKINGYQLKLKYYKSKWGSCTPSKKLICLNINLAFYSLQCIDAIILHELAHIYVMNHSKKFYDVLLTWMPDYKEVVKELKISKVPRLED